MKDSSFQVSVKKLLPLSIRRKLPKEIGIVKVRSIESKRLNKIYRGKDKPTNVLSFFYSKQYGEILVCPEVVRKEAKAQKNNYQYQMTWMIVHGMIHLAGLHHEKSKNTVAKVDDLEQKILQKLFPVK